MILVIDTCGAVGGVALADVGSGQPKIVGEVPITGKTFAAELVPAISSLLGSCSTAPANPSMNACCTYFGDTVPSMRGK